MRITAEQSLPTSLGTLRKFLDEATRLVNADVRSVVSFKDGHLRVCGSRNVESESELSGFPVVNDDDDDDDPFGEADL